MLYISFAWTTAAFLADAKTRTRRNWDDDYAKRFVTAFEKQEPVGALDKLFRAGGKKIGELILTERPWIEATRFMTDLDYRAEGLEWMDQQGLKIKGIHPMDFFCDWKQQDELVWVITFRRIK